MERTWSDVVVIGGGIGGSGLAAILAAGGMDVTVLERTTTFPDRVRGEMWTPWGVAITQSLDLLDPLLAAGAGFSTRWVFYDDAIPTEVAEEISVDLATILPGVPGILNVTHPVACGALFAHAAARGASMRRGVTNVDITDTRVTGTDGSDVTDQMAVDPAHGRVVRWTAEDGTVGEIRTSLVVGADGRASTVRRQVGIELHSAPVRQYMTGLLVDGPAPLSTHIDSYGTGRDVNWYSFPQGPCTSRVYLAHHDVHRYTGPGAVERFLADLAQAASPDVAALAGGRAVSPIATHTSVDTWTDRPYAPGVVLLGDAAGYNDPIIGQGLSLTMADLRDVSRVILAGGRAPGDFEAYGAARSDRHAKQRLAAQTMAELMCSFGEDDAGRRLRALPLLGADETARALAAVMLAGPETLPPGILPLEAARRLMLAA